VKLPVQGELVGDILKLGNVLGLVLGNMLGLVLGSKLTLGDALELGESLGNMLGDILKLGNVLGLAPQISVGILSLQLTTPSPL